MPLESSPFLSGATGYAGETMKHNVAQKPNASPFAFGKMEPVGQESEQER